MKTAIKFRGAQVVYTFPVGITTLTWYAEPNSAVVSRRSVQISKHQRRQRQRRHRF
jgi:hypothetical protein